MKLTKIIVCVFSVGFLLVTGTASAQMGMMGGYRQNDFRTIPVAENEELNDTLKNIYSSQGVSGRDEVDCSKVTDDQFEKLGDAYMGLMLPNESQHEAMDKMMGGEGSSSLRLAHINMGRSYLGCWSNYNSSPVNIPMMGGYRAMDFNGYSPSYNTMMGGWNRPGNYHMSYFWFGWLTMILIWILLILGIIALAKWLRKH